MTSRCSAECGNAPQYVQTLPARVSVGQRVSLPCVPSTTHSIQSYTRAIKTCGRSRKWLDALSLLRGLALEGAEGNLITFNVCISSLQSASSWAHALELLHEIPRKSCSPDIISYNTALEGCAKGGHWIGALHLISEVRHETDLVPDALTVTAVANSCGTSHQWSCAVRLLGKLHSARVEGDVVCYNSFANAFEKAARSSEAEAVLFYMETRGLQADVVTCNTVVNACGKCSRWRAALFILRAMQYVGRRADCITLNSMVCACEQAANWERSMSLLLNVITAVSLQPNCVTCSSAISACAGVQRWSLAVAACDQLVRGALEVNTVVCGVILRALQQGCRWRIAEELRNKLLHSSLEPNAITFSAASSAPNRSDDQWARSLVSHEEMLRMRVPADSLASNVIVEARARQAENYQQVEATIKDMSIQQVQASVVSYTAVMGSCATLGKWQDAHQMFASMLWAGLLPNVVSYGSIIGACAEVASWRCALAGLSQVRRLHQINAVVLTSCIRACAVAQLWLTSMALFVDTAAHVMTRPVLDIIGCGAVVSACERASVWKLCLHVIAWAALDKIAPDSAALVCTLRACGLTRRWEHAVELFGATSGPLSPHADPEAWSATVWACEAGGAFAPGAWPEPSSHRLRGSHSYV